MPQTRSAAVSPPKDTGAGFMAGIEEEEDVVNNTPAPSARRSARRSTRRSALKHTGQHGAPAPTPSHPRGNIFTDVYSPNPLVSNTVTFASPRKRRFQPDEDNPWDPPTKRAHIEFAKAECAAQGLNEEDTEEIVRFSQLSTHRALIALRVEMANQRIDRLVWEGECWMQPNEYRNNIHDALFGYLLDGSVSAYKDGLTVRFLRHIRNKPGNYNIPKHLWPFLGHDKFSEKDIKRKLNTSLNGKKDIYATVSNLIGSNSSGAHSKITVNEQMWGRWAWVALYLSDYNKLHLGPPDAFWDHTDKQLRDHRRKYTYLQGVERKKAISVRFSLSLKKHRSTFKVKKKPNLDGLTESAWQRQLHKAIEEMDSYDAVDTALTLQESTVRSVEEINRDLEAEAAHESTGYDTD
ncbi:hypothetical protein CONPUDRAFT_160396 [Coniophora puteana RWD-64-598 SS2]|uniref:Uncharacterized protein n=1 Tax=Coniophora puteana (strain RWD-64-598) TaxID=741705 RepID=R7SDA4_CONPW|nr:uncharacterized protein CONPUDRAFT_160396 [Coniophora puteana RWD-64-598 SS2]EIW74146.1 hypothetical protein CONPUDRAFT_160396 [Coniophora puteana RWD-64-598 SS2]